MAHGETPTVEAAAEAATVSRATAYRYFPNQVSPWPPPTPRPSHTLLPDNAPADAATRLDLVIDVFTRVTLGTEAQQRTMLRLSLEADSAQRTHLPLRQGRASSGSKKRSLHSTPRCPRRTSAGGRGPKCDRNRGAGWLTDIAGLTRDEAAELMRWSGRALLRSALADNA